MAAQFLELVSANAVLLIAAIVGIGAFCGSLAAILAIEWVDKTRHAQLTSKLGRKGFIVAHTARAENQ